MSEEGEELRKVRFSEAPLCEGPYLDVNSQNGNKLEIKLRESQPTVNQLTQQIKELQEVVKSLKGVSSLQRTARQQVAQGLSTLQADHEFMLAFLASLAPLKFQLC